VVRTVSELLYGQKIDGYFSLGMDAIPVINHLAGGVTVTIEDDFSQCDPTLVMGETVHLNDEQAINYVRGRMDVGDGTNEGRMRRQNAYVEGLKAQMTQKIQADQSYPLEIYHALEDYMVTDLSEKEFSRITNALVNYESAGELELQGTIGVDRFEFATFELNQESLAQAVMDLFYIPVKQ
jgi:anionic cell wall polymer biosynthesis LytR-Cps2A-Psr (LCP) family protein